MVCAFSVILASWKLGSSVHAGSDLPDQHHGEYKVLTPIESGNLLLFPVVRTDGKAHESSGFLTLDEGIKNGQVEVTEAGKASGLVRPRGGRVRLQGDQVNTLVLMNNSKQPLLLLAGEIVTGGKQDRVIAKDRIVPGGSDPIDLSVFCIEPGRWTESSVKFGAAGKMPASGFMVQPSVRQRAMVDKDQQQVWRSVGGAISHMSSARVAPSPLTHGTTSAELATPLATTSYAKVMQDNAVSASVDDAAPVVKARDEVIAKLRAENAVGVVVAVRGEIVWADVFADTELLSRYWTKLVRSYAAESLSGGELRAVNGAPPTVADALRFLDMPRGGSETTDGEVGVYRYHELKREGTDTFVLESLLHGSGYEVHMSKLKVAAPDPLIRPGVILR
jgi:hypothetical protein